MSDVLLINTPTSKINRDPNSEISVPPIGIGYIYTQLTESGLNCKFVDASVDALLPGDVINKINQSNANYIGLNVFSTNVNIIRCIVENIIPSRNLLLGGPAIHTLIQEIITWKTSNNIIIVVGEADNILLGLIEGFIKPEKISNNLSVVYVTSDSPFYPNSIDLPLDRSIFKNEPIHRPDLDLIESHIITSRGCVYDCAFCTAARSVNRGMKPRFRSLDSLNSEIEHIQENHPETNCIRILDDLFLRNMDSIKLAKRLFPQYHLYWRSMAHVNTFRNLSSKNLDDLKQSGCRELFLGIESGNDEVLRHINKPFCSTAALSTVSRIIDAQIPVKCYFILGLPGETLEQLKDTFIFASNLGDYAGKRGVQFRVSPFRFRPYHGTALYKEILSKGQIITEIVSRIDIANANNPYDCVAGVYANYDEGTLDKYMNEMEKLNL